MCAPCRSPGAAEPRHASPARPSAPRRRCRRARWPPLPRRLSPTSAALKVTPRPGCTAAARCALRLPAGKTSESRGARHSAPRPAPPPPLHQPPPPPASHGHGPHPRGGSGPTLHLPPPSPADREEICTEPPPPPFLPWRPRSRPRRRLAGGRDEAPVNLPPPPARRAHKVPALPALPTAGRPRRAAPALRPRGEEGGRGRERGRGGGEAATELGREGGREGAPARGEREEEEGEGGGREPPAPPPSPHRQEPTIRPPRCRRRRRRSPGPARFLLPPAPAPGSAERAAEAPAPQSQPLQEPGRHRAGRGGAQRSARLLPSLLRGHSLVRSRRPPPAAAGPRRLPHRLRSAGHVTEAPRAAGVRGSRRAAPSVGEEEEGGAAIGTAPAGGGCAAGCGRGHCAPRPALRRRHWRAAG